MKFVSLSAHWAEFHGVNKNMEFLTNPILNAVILSVLFAAFMKISNEIGDGRLKFFKGSGVVSGIVWGTIAAYIIVFDNTLANIWMAALAGWILRLKINHLNMSVGATIMFLAYLSNDSVTLLFDKDLFLLFFSVMAVSGLVHDELHKNNILSRKKSELMHSIVSHTILPLGYSFYSGNWIVFASLFSFMVTYEITRNLIYSMEKNQQKNNVAPARKIATHVIRKRTL